MRRLRFCLVCCLFGLWGQSLEAAAAARKPVTASAPAGELTVGRVQVVTVTDTTALITWQSSEPAGGAVEYGTQPDRLDRKEPASCSAVPQRFHACGLTHLQPGTRYYYRCRSGVAKGSDALVGAGEFTTLVPPPGRELFSFATMTDTHVGQEVVGRLSLKGKLVSRGVRWPDPALPFWKLAIEAAENEINSSGVAFTIVKGDITDGLKAGEFSIARRLLDQLQKPYHVVHGNHDVLAPFLTTFGLKRTWYSFDHSGMHFVVLDTEALTTAAESAMPGARYPDASAMKEQFAWLQADLKSHADVPTFVFVHRPLPSELTRPTGESVQEGMLQAGGKLLGQFQSTKGASRLIGRATGQVPEVPPANAARLAAMLRDHGHVVGVFAGHRHRNCVGYWPEQTGNLPYIETASTKEYPCGYTITRVFTGGYMQNYYVPCDPRCLEWSAMTQDVFNGLGYPGKAGALAERSLVVRFDELKLTLAKHPGREEHNKSTEDGNSRGNESLKGNGYQK